MMKQYKKELIVSTLLALLPIAQGCFCGTGFPASLPPIGAYTARTDGAARPPPYFSSRCCCWPLIIWCCFSFFGTLKTGIRAKRWWGCCSG